MISIFIRLIHFAKALGLMKLCYLWKPSFCTTILYFLTTGREKMSNPNIGRLLLTSLKTLKVKQGNLLEDRIFGTGKRETSFGLISCKKENLTTFLIRWYSR